jgi:hypothetical protein
MLEKFPMISPTFVSNWREPEEDPEPVVVELVPELALVPYRKQWTRSWRW